ncbi:MAG TPA: hypothetical protein VNT02_06925, partial [Burkholderiales bacterium]|nr:hypothetical protein [Burkholderiales bacterium]
MISALSRLVMSGFALVMSALPGDTNQRSGITSGICRDVTSEAASPAKRAATSPAQRHHLSRNEPIRLTPSAR